MSSSRNAKTQILSGARTGCVASRLRIAHASVRASAFAMGLIAGCLSHTWHAIALAIEEPREAVTDAPLPPEESARTMSVPAGFQVTLFAGEPDVQQPIGFCFDDRGRLWVAEAYNYPHHGTKPGDRILILEDCDNDGRFDKRTVFYDQLNYVTGIEVGFGGAWIVSPPFFYFIPDRDGDDKPDGSPEVLLDGFGTHGNSHNLANALAWGPDGWLYGTHGRTNWSLLGKPGTAPAERVRFDGGVYRYHPLRHVWESFADGITNPWGIDWNDHGEAFVCNCVTPHLYHILQGAHYEPWRNRESGEFSYQRIPTIADHLHFVGTTDVRAAIGTAEEDAAGGGHAHCGTMVYLGDNWPDEYRNTLFTNNIHGKRINNDLLKRSGSGYIASHGRDLMRATDAWYMGVTLRYGPDGAVYASDWSDTGECHSLVNTRRETGRIFKISYGIPQRRNIDLENLSSMSLCELQHDRNDWYVQHARRLLQERAARGDDLTAIVDRLRESLANELDVPKKLRALWALHSIGMTNAEFLLEQTEQPNESVRGWAIRLWGESPDPSQAALDKLRKLARSDLSPYVRLQLASVLQRLPPSARWAIAEALVAHREDAQDANLPLMYWYAMEPLIHDDPARYIRLASRSQISLVTRHIARRAVTAELASMGLKEIVRSWSREWPAFPAELLSGAIEGLKGRRSVAMPEGWPQLYLRLQHSTNATVRDKATELALIFDDPTALRSLRQVVMKESERPSIRIRALEALIAKRPADLSTLLLELVDDLDLQRTAIRGLAEYDDSRTVAELVANYDQRSAEVRQDILQTLASRPAWAMQLLDYVASEKIPRTEITAFTARQIYNLGNSELATRLTSIWGALQSSSEDKTNQISAIRMSLTRESLQEADRSEGRAIFQKSCASCHRLFDDGGKIGPDITGSQRSNVDYLLQTIIDPNAAVARDYQMQIVVTSVGRVITGLVIDESTSAVTLRTTNESIVVPTAEIETRRTSPQSLMPEGLLQNLTPTQIQQLIAYLMSPTQVRLPQAAQPQDAPNSKSG